MSYSTGRLDLDVTLRSPLHHGAGTSGNTSLLRRMRKIHPETGRAYSVPFVSGNSIRSLIRRNATHYALDVMGYAAGPIPKNVINLLFSGGNLTSGGGAVDLRRARRIEGLFPVLSLMGYSAGNHMTSSKLAVDHLELVCAENAWALPPRVLETPHAAMRLAHFLDEHFGTRKETAGNPRIQKLLPSIERKLLEGEVADRHLVKAKSKKTKAQKSHDTMQMIHDMQVVMPGARFVGRLLFRDVTRLELEALKSGLSYACEERDGDAYIYRLAAKGAAGYGLAAIRFHGEMIRVVAPEPTPDGSLVPVSREEANGDPGLAAYAEHLKAHAEEILSLLEEAAK